MKGEWSGEGGNGTGGEEEGELRLVCKKKIKVNEE